VILEAVLWKEKPAVGSDQGGLVRRLNTVAPTLIGRIAPQPGALGNLLWPVLRSGLPVGNQLYPVGDIERRAGRLLQNLIILALSCFAVSAVGRHRRILARWNWLWNARLGLVLAPAWRRAVWFASHERLKARVASLFFALEPVYGHPFACNLLLNKTHARACLLGRSVLIVLRRSPWCDAPKTA